MKLATTTGDFDGFAESYIERIKHVHEAGFKYIDLSLYTILKNDCLFYNDNWIDEVEKIKHFAAENDITFVQAHSPDTNFFNGTEAYEYAVEKTIRSIEICGMLNIKNTVVHSGYKPGLLDKKIWFEKNRDFYRKLFDTMEKYGVNVLCENTTKANMPDGYFLINGADMREFAEYVNHPLFHVCWDTGHANIEGAQYDEIKAIGDELYALHINDNRGLSDEHLIPYMGTLNMDEIMNALIDIGYNGVFTFESSSALRFNNCWLGGRHVFEKATRLSQPQLFMQKKLEKLMLEIGEYILKSYACYEE